MSVAPPGWQPDSSPSPQSQPQSLQASGGPSAPATQFTAYDAAPAPTAYGSPAASGGQFAPAPERSFAPAGQRSVTQRNPTTFTAIGLVVLYLVLASTTGIVLIGIAPAMLAFRAYQRREPLAPLAVAAAAVAIIFAITVLTHH